MLLLIFNPLGSIALRRLCAGIPTALRPVAFDIVFDFVIPRFPLGEVGARESEDPERICQILESYDFLILWYSMAGNSVFLARNPRFTVFLAPKVRKL